MRRGAISSLRAGSPSRSCGAPRGSAAAADQRAPQVAGARVPTPTGKVELYSAAFAAHGYPPIPTFTNRASARFPGRIWTAEFPLVLTCAKSLFFCETQHRQVASLRRGRRPSHRSRCTRRPPPPAGSPRGTGSRLSHAERSRPGAGEVEREPGPERRRRPARLVGGVRRTGTARLPTLGTASANLNLVLVRGRATRSAELATAGVAVRRRPAATLLDREGRDVVPRLSDAVQGRQSAVSCGRQGRDARRTVAV